MKGRFGNLLAGKLDHGRRDVHANDIITMISKFSCPNATATTEVHDKPIGDAARQEQIQESR